MSPGLVIDMKALLIAALLAFGCADPASSLTVNCSRAATADGISVNCGDANTVNGATPVPDPVALCADSADCRQVPMVCEAYIHCRGGICLCNNVKLSSPECETIDDCPPPLEQFPACSRRSCWEGICQFHPYTEQDPAKACDPDD